MNFLKALIHSNTLQGTLFAFTAVFIWATNPLIATEMSSRINPIEFTFFRWFIAFIFLFFCSFHKLKQQWPLLKKQWLLILVLAVTVPVIDNLFFYQSGHTTSALNISLIGTLTPLFIVFLNLIILKKAITNMQAAGVLLALFGVIYIIINGDLDNLATFQINIGDLFILIATMAFSCYTFLQYKKDPRISPHIFLTAITAVGSIILLPFLIISELHVPNILNFHKTEVFVLIYTGVCVALIAYLCWNMAITKIGALRTGIIDYFAPLMVAIIAATLLQHPITSAQIIGGSGIILGCIMLNLPAKPKPKKLR